VPLYPPAGGGSAVFPPGGATGTALEKLSPADNDVGWSPLGTGGDGSGTHALFDDGTFKTIDASVISGGPILQYLLRQFAK
jgi:hypothetical protein